MKLKAFLTLVMSTSLFAVSFPSKTLAQGNWGSVDSSTIYTNPDTRQRFCHYDSGLWAPCPGEGNATRTSPSGGKCFGGMTMQDLMNQCPRARCELDSIDFSGSSARLSCEGLP